MTATPIFDATAAKYAVDYRNLTDFTTEAVEQRSTPADKERGARLVARIADLEAEK